MKPASVTTARVLPLWPFHVLTTRRAPCGGWLVVCSTCGTSRAAALLSWALELEHYQGPVEVAA